jgi:hypothetical protein
MRRRVTHGYPPPLEAYVVAVPASDRGNPTSACLRLRAVADHDLVHLRARLPPGHADISHEQSRCVRRRQESRAARAMRREVHQDLTGWHDRTQIANEVAVP